MERSQNRAWQLIAVQVLMTFVTFALVVSLNPSRYAIADPALIGSLLCGILAAGSLVANQDHNRAAPVILARGQTVLLFIALVALVFPE